MPAASGRAFPGPVGRPPNAIGTAFGQLELRREASEYFQSVATAADGTELADQAAQLRAQLDDAFFGREYLRGSLQITQRYDSNPAVIPDANAFGAPLFGRPSAGNKYFATVSYDLLRDYNYDVTTGYTVLHSSNYKVHGFDLFDNAAYLSLARRSLWRGKPLRSEIRFDYDYLTVGGDSYLQRLQVAPSWTVRHSDCDATNLLFRYILYDFLGQGIADGTPFDQDANSLTLGLIQQRRLGCRDSILFGGYLFDHTFSEGSNFDYSGRKLFVGLHTGLPWHDMQLAVTGNIHFRRYTHPNSLLDVHRNDNDFFVNLKLLYPITDMWRAVLEWNFDRNNSNLRFNDYRRDVLDIGLEYLFPTGFASRS